MKVIVKLSGADVIGAEYSGDTVAASPDIEVRQYHRDFQDPETVDAQGGDGSYEVVWPLDYEGPA